MKWDSHQVNECSAHTNKARVIWDFEVVKHTLSFKFRAAGILLVLFFIFFERGGVFLIHPLAATRWTEDFLEFHILYRALFCWQKLIYPKLQDLAELCGAGNMSEKKWWEQLEEFSLKVNTATRDCRIQRKEIMVIKVHKPWVLQRLTELDPVKRSDLLQWQPWWGAAWTRLECTLVPPQCVLPEGGSLSQVCNELQSIKE